MMLTRPMAIQVTIQVAMVRMWWQRWPALEGWHWHCNSCFGLLSVLASPLPVGMMLAHVGLVQLQHGAVQHLLSTEKVELPAGTWSLTFDAHGMGKVVSKQGAELLLKDLFHTTLEMQQGQLMKDGVLVKILPEKVIFSEVPGFQGLEFKFWESQWCATRWWWKMEDLKNLLGTSSSWSKKQRWLACPCLKG